MLLKGKYVGCKCRMIRDSRCEEDDIKEGEN